MHVVLIGVFDGVHRGHQALVQQAIARSEGGPVTIVTFNPHPAAILRPDSAPLLLSGIDRRVKLLHAAGADHVRVIEFTPEFSALSPEQFVDQLLDSIVADVVDEHENPVPVDVIVAGVNFRFGQYAAGNIELLTQLGKERGFNVQVVELVTEEVRDEGTVTWSSSFVRERIAAGDLPGAARALGRPHRVEGTVVHGEKRGRELGFPTANVELSLPYAVPPDGVYAGWLLRGTPPHTTVLPAAISVGTNPQFNGTARSVEVYCLHDHTLDLYDESVGVEFVARIRGQAVFDSIDGLVQQMNDDVERARTILGAQPRV